MSKANLPYRPPNRLPGAGIPGPIPPTPGGPGSNLPPIEIVGGATVVIQIGEVKLTIEGPVTKVFPLLGWLFGPGKSATVAGLQLEFGPQFQSKK